MRSALGIGGEALSLAINYTGSEGFRSAGYAEIQANDSYVSTSYVHRVLL